MPKTAAFDNLAAQALASSAKTVNGAAAAIVVGSAEGATLIANITSVSGTTPTLVLDIEESHDGTVWATLAESAVITAPGVVRLAYAGPCGPRLRVSWTVGGTTPSFTLTTSLREQ